ncbi:MAG: acyl-CoA dehydrogenase family protein [Myxococcota bacterium]|nr:acyl-CoA dehydrogenase family protein [Myxococcota bacterium]
MDFSLPAHLQSLRSRVRDFMEQRIIPLETTIIEEDKTQTYDTLRNLQAAAKGAGLWTPHLPEEFGGLGLGIMGMCVLFREMGRSPVGARVFNCDAPDQGNMDLLLKTASPAIKERWLAPLCAGDITSGFCMTEPAPGAGADPSNLSTTATRDGDGWVLNGHKWYTTGGNAASFLIVMARTGEDSRSGASMFVIDRHAPGVEHMREIPVMAPPLLVHREAEFRFTDVRVGSDQILGQEGEGFMLAQKRLVPARLTHCMRWLGQADRALQMCREYVIERRSFGRRLAEHQLIQKMIADNAVAIHMGNLMTFHCAWMLEQGAGREARPYSSMAKNHVARLLCQVLDDAIQMHGGLGYSDDLPFATWYRGARAARIADGPDEVHTMVVARDFLRNRLNLLV